MQGIMAKDIEGQSKDWYKDIEGYRKIGGEGYLDIEGCTVYLDYSRTQVGVALDEYEALTDREDVRIKDGRHVYVKVSDLEQILITRKPLTARSRGLIKD